MELEAPPHWHRIEFISDLHLQADDPQTFRAWGDYLQNTKADALFILGDLFEVWVGDDVLTLANGFESQCATLLRATATRIDVHVMQGNRDFLMGPAFMKASGCTALADPTALSFASQRWLLTHGDGLCLDDTGYMQFRAMVRSPQWQSDFLGKSLSERMALARQMRRQSEVQKSIATAYADVDTAAALSCMNALRANHMIHGHTHRPATHWLSEGKERIVLSDWDLAANPPRAEVLSLTANGPHAPHGLTVERICWSAKA
jgi:UDP-2,3-diacylglucosamine hydrolase